MENNLSLISIIVPVYNEEKTILEVLKKLIGYLSALHPLLPKILGLAAYVITF